MENSLLLFFVIIFLWLAVISYLFYRLGHHYDNLTRGINKNGLREILEELLKKVDTNSGKIEKLEKWCQKLQENGSYHIQKVGLLRFNPFSDTGGDQSFIISVCDEHNNGLVLTSLHSRAGTRWYAKSVRNGKGIEHELSVDEEKVIKKAKTVV